MADMGPGLRREDEEGDAAINHLNASEHLAMAIAWRGGVRAVATSACGRTVMAAAFTTAIEAWDKRWATAEGRADWLEPEPDVIALLPELKARGARTALDLGCGVGRHALVLAEHGLAVEALDGSAAGLTVVRETAQARGLSLAVRQGTADALPFDDGSFDFVLSWNVIHHGTLGDVGRRLAEIWRVLKPKALYQGTMLPTRNSNYGRGRTVAPTPLSATGPRSAGTRISIAMRRPSLRYSPGSSCSL
jgi:SAM-dependent methyltransferase